MKNYITLENEYYEILIPETLREYGNGVLNYTTKKLKEYLLFFNEISYGKKLKGAIMINREDFIQRINEVRDPNSSLPPSWATGCFYGGEVQILLDLNNPYEKFFTLAHETFHLLFQKFIYEKNNWDRIVWLDESLAGNFDGTTEKMIENGYFEEIILKYLHNSKLPKMETLAFSKNNVKTDYYNGYELFKIVGRYLLETKTKSELFIYINNINEIEKDGKRILKNSLIYFSQKFNLN